MNHLRRNLPAIACALALGAGAASGTPPALEPLPEIPAPANLEDSELETQITIIQKERETVEEARVGGAIVWIRVTPRHGRPYYLIPTGSGNTYIRRDSLDSALKVPMWVLLSW
jgi:hypothetical protein